MTWQFSRDLDWMRDAACVGLDGDLFFGGNRGGRPTVRSLPCGVCAVQEACRDYAMQLPDDTLGIWGGALVSELRRSVNARSWADSRGWLV